jgi:beta-glucosidase
MLAALLLVSVALVAAEERPWMAPKLSPSQRAQALLAQMNLTEKIDMVHGWDGPYVGNVIANTRLGIPSLNLNDGPQGFRDDAHVGTTTQWPSGLTVAATWDVDAMFAWGDGMGEEFVGKGANVQLGPGINVARVPLNGRNFEYLSGEDPFLGATLVQPVIKGIQGNGVIANMKHYINNNQETNRGNVSANVDERTRMEMYSTAFGGAVEAGVLSVMCSYNRINVVWSCENPVTLNGELKTAYNFSGWVMSDWGATHSTIPSALAGLDQEMPDNQYFGQALIDAIQAGNVSESTLDDKVLRILTPMFIAGLFDNPNTGNIANNVTSVAHNELARSLAGKATVLLQNYGILPLNAQTVGKIAVIGSAAFAGVITGGGGSGSVVPYYQVTPLQGVVEAMGGTWTPPPPRPATCTMEEGIDYYQPGNPSAPGTSAQDCCAQCAALSNCQSFAFSSGNTCWFKPNADGRRVAPGVTAGNCTYPIPPMPLPANVLYDDGSNLTSAAATAAAADIAIVVVATTSSEGTDRPNLDFPNGQDDVVFAVAAAQPNTIVVCINPGAVLTPWSSEVQAVLAMFMPGQEEGHAMADVLFGDVDPGGRLPLTFPNIENEVNFTQAQYPGLPADNPLIADYTEMLEIGYRYYQTHDIQPKFAFGHGLSYSTYTYSNLQVNGRNVSFDVTNDGSRTGYEVPQMYLGFPASAGEPPLQLKGFTKLQLTAGQTTTVTFTVQDRDLSIWDVTEYAFVPQSGIFEINVGASSEDIRLYGTLTN